MIVGDKLKGTLPDGRILEVPLNPPEEDVEKYNKMKVDFLHEQIRQDGHD